MIKATGHENAYFPLFIPLSYLEREAGHVEGFAKECAVVTHHRLEQRGGKLVPAAELDQPLIVRPTSETINFRILELYRSFTEDYLAIPVIAGEKSPRARFPGADRTYSIEAMMQDRKALQAGTSHYLGQNFAWASGIRLLDSRGQVQYAYTTSWGVSTRLVGAMIMAHGDDDGLRVPPRVAPSHIVITPLLKQPALRDDLMHHVNAVATGLRSQSFDGGPIRVHVDSRDIPAPDKKWQWVKRGVPLRVEIGPRDMQSDTVFVSRRDQAIREASSINRDEFIASTPRLLEKIQRSYLLQAQAYRDQQISSGLTCFADFERFLTPSNADKPEIHGGFLSAKWCGNPLCEDKAAALGVSIRCLPLAQSGREGNWIICGVDARTDAIFAKAY